MVLFGLVAWLSSGCAGLRSATEQRSTHGLTAEQVWTYRILVQNGREPTFEERQRWDLQLDLAISQYLAAHPEVANSLDVSTFRFARQVTVGMTKEQVVLLLGPPVGTTADQAQIEKLARKYWPLVQAGKATEAWVYPLGWNLYFVGPELADMTQDLPPE
jgi:hypothetical protein